MGLAMKGSLKTMFTRDPATEDFDSSSCESGVRAGSMSSEEQPDHIEEPAPSEVF